MFMDRRAYYFTNVSLLLELKKCDIERIPASTHRCYRRLLYVAPERRNEKKLGQPADRQIARSSSGIPMDARLGSY